MKKLILSLLALATMAFAFNSCSDVPEPYDQPSVSPDSIKGNGTADNPYTVAQAMEIIKNGTNTSDPVYVKGKVVQLGEFNSQYGNYTYYINDTETTDNALEIYRGKGLGNKNFTSDSDLKLTDEVVVCGVLTNYNGTFETASSPACYIYSLNGQLAPENPSAEPSGTGTQADPFNVAAAIKAASALDANGKVEGVYVTGIVSKVDEVNTQFGNATYYISDDGSTTNQFEIYRGYYLNGDKFTSASQIKTGDKVVVKGDLVNFKGNTLEMTQGNQIVNINGGSSTTKGDGTQANPYSASEAYSAATALDENGKIEGAYITGTISSIKEVNANYGNATYNISDDGTTSGSQFTVFRGRYLNGDKFTSESQIKVGDKVVVKGDIVNYKGNTPELAQGGEIVSINSSSSDNPSTPTGNADVEIAASSLGLSNAADIGTVNLNNGITITGNAGSGSNTPKFYTAGNGTIRMYPGNYISISANSRIANIIVECDSYNGTNYIAEGKMTASNGSVNLNDLVYTVSGINGQTVTLTNSDSGSGAKTQLRIKTLKIYYAK